MEQMEHVSQGAAPAAPVVPDAEAETEAETHPTFSEVLDAYPQEEAQEPEPDVVEALAARLERTALADRPTPWTALTSKWIDTAEEQYRKISVSKQGVASQVTKSLFGTQMRSDEDFSTACAALYGAETRDWWARTYATNGSPTPYQDIMEWISANNAAMVENMDPVPSWTEPKIRPDGKERNLDPERIACGVGFKKAAMLARSPEEAARRPSEFYVYVAHLMESITNGFRDLEKLRDAARERNSAEEAELLSRGPMDAQKAEQLSALRAKHKEDAAKTRKGPFITYKRLLERPLPLPNSAEVYGDYLLMLWSSRRGDFKAPPKDVIGIVNLGNVDPYHIEYQLPAESISSVALAYPYLVFVTSSDHFLRNQLLQASKNFEEIAGGVKQTLAQNGGVPFDIVIVYKITDGVLERAIPCLEKDCNIGKVCLYPRQTFIEDEHVPHSNYRVMWCVTSTARPDLNGVVVTEPLLMPEAELPEDATSNEIYWRNPDEELTELETLKKRYLSSPVQDVSLVSRFPGGHVACLSNDNMSLVIRETTAWRHNVDHFRDWPTVLDVSIFGLAVAVLHSDYSLRLYHMRPAHSGIRSPKFLLQASDISKEPATDPRNSWKQTKPKAYRAIWQAASLCVAQMPDCTLVLLKGPTPQEIRVHLAKLTAASHRSMAKRLQARISERTVAEARAKGTIPAVMEFAEVVTKIGTQ